MQPAIGFPAPRSTRPPFRKAVPFAFAIALPAILLTVEPLRLLLAVWNVPGSPLSWQPFAGALALLGATSRRRGFAELAEHLEARFPDPNRPERSTSPFWVIASTLTIGVATLGRVPSLAYLSLVALFASVLGCLRGPFAVRLSLPFLLLAALGTPVPPTMLRPLSDSAARGSAIA
ncbi:MAG: hypothetical protein ACKO5K_01615, partial [Armatimonadota bacterium]